MIAYDKIEIRIPIRAHMRSLFACFNFSGSPLAVISLNPPMINTTIHTTQMPNRRYSLMVWSNWKKEDSSPWICVGPVTATSGCPWLFGTCTTIAKEFNTGKVSNRVRTIFFHIMFSKTIKIIVCPKNSHSKKRSD